MASSISNQPSKYVTLVSSDGFEFVVLREVALHSPFMKSAFRGEYLETKTGLCRLEDINGAVLEKLIEYLYYYHKNIDKDNVPDMDIPIEMCLQLLEAADFLGMGPGGPY